MSAHVQVTSTPFDVSLFVLHYFVVVKVTNITVELPRLRCARQQSDVNNTRENRVLSPTSRLPPPPPPLYEVFLFLDKVSEVFVFDIVRVSKFLVYTYNKDFDFLTE